MTSRQPDERLTARERAKQWNRITHSEDTTAAVMRASEQERWVAMGTILLDAYDATMNNVLMGLLAIIGGVVFVGLACTAVSILVAIVRGKHSTPVTPAPDMPLMDTTGALAPLPVGVAAWLIADTEAAWAARQGQQRQGGNGHE